MSPASNERPEDMSSNADSSQGQQNQIPEGSGAAQDKTSTQITPLSQSTKRAATAPVTATYRSPITSPRDSRETSPVRQANIKLAQNAARVERPRKNSQDLSPSRGQNTAGRTSPDTPSAAAVQRALSATPRLPSPASTEHASDPSKPPRTSRSPAGNHNSANTSSRVRSPPNQTSSSRSSSAGARKNDRDQTATATPRIVVDDTAKSSSKSFGAIAEEEDNDDMPSGVRSPPKSKSASGVLEVVHESSLPEAPAISAGASLQNGRPRNARSTGSDIKGRDSFASSSAAPTESGSESAGSKSLPPARKEAGNMPKAATPAKPPALRPNNSFTQLSTTKNKVTGDPPAGNMTVETETVTSVPSAGVAGVAQREAAGRTEGSGTLRLKASSETIRPKKERKRPMRKPATVQSGTASSKADIFEAKVASAVDEADSSDSAETFVYESNPPEPFTRPHRYHSRTPSAASTTSQDHYGNRYRPEGQNSIAGKKSMKFANNSHNLSGHQGDGENGSHAGTVGSGRGPAANGSHHRHHHHIGRHGRATGHTSLFDKDAPFPDTNKPASPTQKQGRISSRVDSPRSPFAPKAPNSSRSLRSAYNLEDDVADDERTPLIPARNLRARHGRRPASRQDQYRVFRPRGILASVLCWLGLGLLITLLIAAIIVALVLCSQTLTQVRVRDIQNVIASEEEIVFDLHMHAVNPNMVAVQVNYVDIKVFAKSKHVGSSRTDYGHHDSLIATRSDTVEPSTNSMLRADYGKRDGVDEGTDPIEVPVGGDTMLLGRVYELDSPMTFQASPIAQRVSSDFGEVSIAYPGNGTADQGSNRWKVVVQHTFELIVVGQLKYTLPISSKNHTVNFGQAKKTVDPRTPVKDKGAACSGWHCTERRLELPFIS